MSDELLIGARPPHPPPRRVRLGADAWVLLAAALARAETRMPPPFGVDEGPALDGDQHAATLAALRAAGLVAGDSGDLLADLHPSLRESLRAHEHPLVLAETRVGLGDELSIARHAVRGELVSAIVREQRPLGGGRLELGPVQLSTMLLDDLASDVLRAFGDLDGDPARESLRMDAAVSLAAVEALAGARPDLAQAVLEQPAAPALLHELAAGLLAVAQVTVAAANGMQVLVALRLDDGWWSTALVDDDVLLDPVGEDELVSWLAAALTSALTAGASS